ncbi:MAG: class I SAM-dependent methyltransferase [Defluviitaleaceae bacterium]|nr:class I SAM-dependent methyltransferase [Defluviitaleaceae bacterium]
MQNNAWHLIKPNDYDAHMSHPNVAQTQMLSKIMKEQFELLSAKQRSDSCVAILGITNGNGLEHIESCDVSKIIGIDINKAFLEECKVRFSEIEPKLNLYQIDLMTETIQAVEVIEKCDLIIANLLIKHIHLDNFSEIVSGLPKRNQIISCVIQVNPDGVAVSQSGFEYVFKALADQREEENEDTIIAAMNENGFTVTNRVKYDLPNGKQFIRLDFTA